MGGDRQKYSSDIAAVLSSSEDGAGNRFSDLISAVGFGSGRRIGGDVSTDLVRTTIPNKQQKGKSSILDYGKNEKQTVRKAVYLGVYAADICMR